MKSTNSDKISQKVASILLDVGAVFFRPGQPFRFDSGILSPVYVDNRTLISFPMERRVVIEHLISKIKNEIDMPETIAGVATAGIAHAAWIADKLNLPMVYVRSKPKDHGRGSQVEGQLKRGQKVLVVEDMISTAGSSVRVIEALRKVGAQVSDEIAIYTHLFKKADQNFKKLKVRFHSLTDLKDITRIALKRGYLKKDQVETILAWSEDPENWGKKMGFG